MLDQCRRQWPDIETAPHNVMINDQLLKKKRSQYRQCTLSTQILPFGSRSMFIYLFYLNLL